MQHLKDNLVCSCGWPNSRRINQSILASFVLIKSTLSSAFAAEAATNYKMAQVMRILPLSSIGISSTGMLPRKKYAPTQLLHLPVDW